MASGSTVFNRLALALLAFLWAVNVYRAATQSITIDEAITYNDFVAPRYLKTIQRFDANNHVLNTLLCRASVAVLGVSEFALRIPSLLAGLAYFAALYRLARRAFGDGAWFLLVVALGSLNPFLLDHLTAARGYGMGLALMLWLIDALMDDALLRAGILMGLAVVANAMFVFPVGGLVAIYLLLDVRRFWPFVERALIPGITVAFVPLVIPFSHVVSEELYFGATEWNNTVSRLGFLSLLHHVRPWVAWGFPIDKDTIDYWLGQFLGPPMLLLMVFLAVATERVFARLRQGSPGDGRERLLVFCGGSLVLSVLGIELAHRLTGMPYPVMRTSLFAVPLLVLAAVAALREIRWRWMRRAGWCLGCLIVLQFCVAFNVSRFGEWSWGADLKSAARFIGAQAGNRPIRIRATWTATAVLQFYRTRDRRWNWISIDREPFDKPADYLVLVDEDVDRAREHGRTILVRYASSAVAR